MNSDHIKTIFPDNTLPVNHVLVIEDENSRHTIILEDSEYSIGRDPRNKIALRSKKISRFHATLRKRNDVKNNSSSFWILDGDLQGGRSTNGVYINGKRCLVQELKHGDIISIGYDVQASYYTVASLSELPEIEKYDFGEENVNQSPLASDSEEKTNSSYGTKSKLAYVNRETLVISEPNLESEDNLTTDNSNLDKLASFPELSPNPIIEIDWQGNITYVNPSAYKKFPELKTMRVIDDSHPLFVGLVEGVKNYGNNNNLFVRETHIKNHILEQYIHYLGEQKLIRSYLFDFTKRSKVFETQFRDNEQRYKSIIEQTKNGILLVDLQNYKVLEVNNAICDFLGYSINEINTYSLPEIIDTEENKFWHNFLPKLINNDQEYFKGEVKFKSKNQKVITLQSTVNLINYGDQKILFFDVHPLNNESLSSLNNSQQDILYDLETGLPNRQFFLEQLNISIANSRRYGNLMCVLMIELEFLYNDKESLSYGLKLNILEGFAKRLRSCFRSGDTVAKWDKNKFIVILSHLNTIRDVGTISERILQTLKPPFYVENRKVYTKTSIGITMDIEEVNTPETVLNKVNQALEKSKDFGSNNYKFFQVETQKEIERLIRLEKLLEHALNLQEFSLDYQPQININQKQITGIEALIRWQHPELGKISPHQFLPLAEETGLIIPIGEWMIKTACEQQKIWQQNGVINHQPISVNISTQQLQQPNFVSMIANILETTGLEPKFLELEIKENTIITEQKLAEKNISKLTDLGVKISLDDFGIDLIALGLLAKYNFYRIKIEKNIIQNLTPDSFQGKIVSLLIDLGKICHSCIVVKGVKSQEQLDLLGSFNCEEFQGNLLTEPLSKDDLTNFLANPTLNF